MSTLLERMILRTRAPLSSLEPLSRPRFAPADPARHAWAGSAAGITEHPAPDPGSTDQGPRSGGRAEAGHRSPRRPDADRRADGSAASGAEPLPAGPGPRGAPSGSARPEAVPSLSVPSLGVPPPVARPLAGRPREDRRPEPGRAATGRLGQGNGEPAPDTAIPVRRAGEASGAVRDRGIEDLDAPAAAEPGVTPAVRPVTVSARLLPAAPPARLAAGRPRSPASPEPTANTEGTRPDVIISIGHIEVCSAPTVEQPPALGPFRPRVSLSDFLSQQRDQP